MSDWVVVLTPLLVLPTLLLFRFIGCDKLVGLDPLTAPPTYVELISKEASLVAYWRLADQQNAPQASDETGANPGFYGQPPATSAQGTSQAASGLVIQGQAGLPNDDPGGMSVDFQGGYVFVPFADSVLNTPSFTVEAWVLPGAWQPGFDHAVVTAEESAGGINRGFSVFARWHPVEQTSFWSASLGTGATFMELPGPAVTTPATTTYLALTYDGTTAILYVASVRDNWDAVQTMPVSGYLPIQSNGFYIGANHLTLPPQMNPPPPPQPAPPVDFPFIGQIQEVALYSAALNEATLAKRRSSTYL